MLKRLIIGLLLLALAFVGFGAWRNFNDPDDLYLATQEFAGCPERPSCVSSKATDDLHRVAALGYTGDMSSAFVLLREVVERLGGKIEQERPDYLHAVFESPELKLRDDMELLLLPEGKVEVRSVSRFNWHDRGANRARVEELRRAFEAMP
jgi:uncharacterized protein (DUF1499 family)